MKRPKDLMTLVCNDCAVTFTAADYEPAAMRAASLFTVEVSDDGLVVVCCPRHQNRIVATFRTLPQHKPNDVGYWVC